MNKTKNIIGAVAIAIVVIGGIVFATKSPYVKAPATGDYGTTGATMNTTGAGTTTGGTTGATATSYTLAEIAMHKDASSCWTTIGGAVYDLTAWVAQHPGGEGAILSICGKDGTAAFEGQHGDNRKANSVLAGFKIGTLK